MLKCRVQLNTSLSIVPNDLPSIEAFLEAQKIYCIASGESEGVMKIFGYAATKLGTECLVELAISPSAKKVEATIKTTNQAEEQPFRIFLEDKLTQN